MLQDAPPVSLDHLAVIMLDGPLKYHPRSGARLEMGSSDTTDTWAAHAAHASHISSVLVLSIKRQILHMFVFVCQMRQAGYVWKLLRKCHLNRMARRPPFMRWHPWITISRSCTSQKFPKCPLVSLHWPIYSPPSLPHHSILNPTLPLWDHVHMHDWAGWVPSVSTVCFQTGMSSVHADKFRLNTGL